MDKIKLAAIIGDVAALNLSRETRSALNCGDLRVYATNARETLHELETKLERINKSPDFTERGKVAARRRAGRRPYDQVEGIDAAANRLELVVEQARRELTVRPADEQRSAVAEIRAMELRRALAEVEQLEREAVFREAIANGDAELFEAVRGAPRFLSLVDEEVIREGELAWAEKTNPETARTLSEGAAALKALRVLAESARENIAKSCGLAEADPLATSIGDIDDDPGEGPDEESLEDEEPAAA